MSWTFIVMLLLLEELFVADCFRISVPVGRRPVSPQNRHSFLRRVSCVYTNGSKKVIVSAFESL